MSFQNTGNIVKSDKGLITIESTATGNVYVVKRPGGQLATEYMATIMDAMPVNIEMEVIRVQRVQIIVDKETGEKYTEPMWKRDPVTNEMVMDEDGDPVPLMEKQKSWRMSENDLKRQNETFKLWAPKFLPMMIVDGLQYNDMPAEDQLAIFHAMLQKMNAVGSTFRYIADGERNGQGKSVGTVTEDTTGSI